jgi:hypothetical protein
LPTFGGGINGFLRESYKPLDRSAVVAAWEEGKKDVEKAKLFTAGSFVALMLVAIYAAATGQVFDAIYFACFSLISLVMFLYVRKLFRVKES